MCKARWTSVVSDILL
uniref:Uncharacterized protein n=1 Tax=Rhizophora mucronata TaxID=61149 RepID=A0A2P2QES0_RHIMU